MILSRRAIGVLLVEDSDTDAALIGKSLGSSDEKFEIHRVTRLAGVAGVLEEASIDIVLATIDLPDSRGVETVTALRALAPNIPLVVLSSSDDQTARSDALRLGAIDFIPKSGSFKITLAQGLTYAIARTQQETSLHDIVEANSDAAVVVDREGTILYANHGATRLFGVPRAKLIGTHFAFPIADRSVVEIQMLDGAKPRTAELRIVELAWGDRDAYLASIRDITDHERAAELERRLIHADRLASIGQLAAGVAHEINNPSTFIQANCSLMAEEAEALVTDLGKLRDSLIDRLGPESAEAIDAGLDEIGLDFRLREMGEMLAECVGGIKRITATVKDLSTFSRVERDEIEMADINQLADVACNMVRNDLKHRAELVRDYETLPRIAVDRAKMTQVFVNLLVNASHAIEEATTAGEHRVTLSTRHVDGSLVVVVEDTGCGIDDRHLEKIFEPFFTTKARDRGTGLGLALVAETIHKHGGQIDVDSQVGHGTRFEIRLPEITGLRAREPAAPTASVKQPRASARLLIVDDEPLLRRAFRRVLRGHDVVGVETGAAALEILREDREFDMIICDLMMPNLDGPGLYEALVELDPELAERMVFVTGGAVTSRGQQFVSKHQPIVLEKPVSREKLLGIIDRISR